MIGIFVRIKTDSVRKSRRRQRDRGRKRQSREFGRK
jgi:hypothetical protein